MVNRVIREDPSKSSMHNRQPITPRLLWDSVSDYDLWPVYLLGLNFQTPMSKSFRLQLVTIVLIQYSHPDTILDLDIEGPRIQYIHDKSTVDSKLCRSYHHHVDFHIPFRDCKSALDIWSACSTVGPAVSVIHLRR